MPTTWTLPSSTKACADDVRQEFLSVPGRNDEGWQGLNEVSPQRALCAALPHVGRSPKKSSPYRRKELRRKSVVRKPSEVLLGKQDLLFVQSASNRINCVRRRSKRFT